MGLLNSGAVLCRLATIPGHSSDLSWPSERQNGERIVKQACGRLRRADIIFIAISSLQVEGMSSSSASLGSCNRKA